MQPRNTNGVNGLTTDHNREQHRQRSIDAARDTQRWAVVEYLSKGNRVFYFYSKFWGTVNENKAVEVMGHACFTVEYAGKINREGRLVDVPPAHHTKLVADNNPSRETRK